MKKVLPYLLIMAVLIAATGWVVFSNRQKSGQVKGLDDLGTASLPQPPTDQNNQLNYSQPTYGFSFSHPATISVGSLEENGGDMFLIQDKTKGTIAQIFVTEFDEEGELTPSRILRDLPGQKIENGKYVMIGDVKAIMFDSQEEGIGQTWEVWFTYSGFLYQISAQPQNREVVESILATWKW